MQASPATANVNCGYWNPWMVMAAPTADTPDPTSASTRRGSIPMSEVSGAAIAATAHAITRSRIVCAFDAATMGSSRYSTVIASTGHTAWAMAEAAGGAVVAVPVTHECTGHNARRPATPTNRRTEATTSWRTVHPAVV